MSHPECNAEVIANSDFVGGTEQMLEFMRKSKATRFLMLTECGLSSRLQSEFPDKDLVGSCTLCKYMKSNALEDIAQALKHPTPQQRIILDEGVRLKALTSLQAMFKYAQKLPVARTACE